MSIELYKKMITDAFDCQDLNYSIDDNGSENSIIRINFSENGKRYLNCRVIIFENGICDIEAALPFICPNDKLHELSYYLTEINYSIRYATMRLDVNDGEIVNSYSFDVNNTTSARYFYKKFLNVHDIEEDVYQKIASICGHEN